MLVDELWLVSISEAGRVASCAGRGDREECGWSSGHVGKLYGGGEVCSGGGLEDGVGIVGIVLDKQRVGPWQARLVQGADGGKEQQCAAEEMKRKEKSKKRPGRLSWPPGCSSTTIRR